MKIEIAYFEGCPNRELAESRVREVLEELGLRAEIAHLEVRDQAAAIARRFPGSPTVRVDGQDVAPADTEEPSALRCRLYPTPSGIEGAPDKDAIRFAILRGIP